MLLRGSLNDSQIGDLLAWLAAESRSGVLTLHGEHALAKVMLVGGAITAADLVPRAAASELCPRPRDREQLERFVAEILTWTAGEFSFEPAADGSEAAAGVCLIGDLLADCQSSSEKAPQEPPPVVAAPQKAQKAPQTLDQIPRVTASRPAGDVLLSADEWLLIAYADGRTNGRMVVNAAGLDRRSGVEALESLVSRGLIVLDTPSPTSQSGVVRLGLRGPISIYNETFVSTLSDGAAVSSVGTETVGDEELPVSTLTGGVLLEGDEQREVQVTTLISAAPDQLWERLTSDCVGWIILANANDVDSLRQTRRDLEFVRSLGDMPLVIAAYVSMAGEELSAAEIAAVVGLPPDTAIVMPCQIRDPESVYEVVRALASRLLADG